jgi:hypothetical protein
MRNLREAPQIYAAAHRYNEIIDKLKSEVSTLKIELQK